MSWLAGAVAEVFDAVEAWAGHLSALDFMLVVVGVWAGYWLWSGLRAMTRLGPVEVELIAQDVAEGTAGADVHALTALLRERLGRSGLLPPPEVPAGSPQANLISAVESSGAPQAAWVGALLKLVPQPPRPAEFTLESTLVTETTPAAGTTVGLRYWLRPRYAGRARLDTVQRASSQDAILHAAADIYLEISRDAMHVIPRWAHWELPCAFLLYIEGIDHRLAGRDDCARAAFESSIEAEPRNLLPRLQLANLLEKQFAGVADAELEQARILRRYLDIAVDCPSLVAARYRAAVVAGALAGSCAEMAAELQDEIRDTVGLDTEEKLDKQLGTVSSRESKAALQLLKPFHVIFDERRLRHRFEPTGEERRDLRRTIAISRHARKIRRFPSGSTTWWIECRILGRRARLRCIQLGLRRGGAGWNTHYNAGCFYALLYGRELRLAGPPAAAATGAEAGRARTLRRRAIEELNRAIELAGPQLSGDWLERGDRDLESLRASDDQRAVPGWELLVRRHTGKCDPSDRQMPESAWGEPTRRRNKWLRFATIWVGLAIVAWLVSTIAAEVAFGVALVGFAAAGYFSREVRLANRQAGAERQPAAGVASRGGP